MKRILIDKGIEKIATDYREEIKKLPDIYSELNKLERELHIQGLTNEEDYVQTIRLNLEDILTKNPDDYDTLHTTLFSKYDAGGRMAVDLTEDRELKDSSGTKHKWKMYMHIVNALQYDIIQETVFPKYARRLGIRSCVYCNAQFSVSAKKGKTDRGKRFRSTYTIDHWKPKSEFPYLAIAFYNLYPCCSPCNQAKSKKPAVWSLYCQVWTDVNPFEFRLDDQSYLDYLVNWNHKTLKIKFLDKSTGQTPQQYDNYFHITKLYNNFTPEVEDVIWRKRIYNADMVKAMQQSGVYMLKPRDVNRFIIGNYDRTEDILKRPLAKLIQDVARQLGVI